VRKREKAVQGSLSLSFGLSRCYSMDLLSGSSMMISSSLSHCSLLSIPPSLVLALQISATSTFCWSPLLLLEEPPGQKRTPVKIAFYCGQHMCGHFLSAASYFQPLPAKSSLSFPTYSQASLSSSSSAGNVYQAL
jgi:hypothetical protein